MKTEKFVIVLGLALLVFVPGIAEAQSMVILVRHAERADGGPSAGTGMTGAPADPLLSAAGKARADKLATMLAESGVKAIYTSEFHRTQDTGKPLAAKLGLTVTPVASSDVNVLVKKVKAEHPKDVVLIVGHSNTVPAAIKAFGGPDVKMADDEYTAIYIVSPATGAMTLIRY
ncbi:MAG TPA: histidine phosphatase family protein [Vicinamibacterales bacterium]|nr:histidine phosphatase family protein [Vicinamibacterales bacterium]